MSVADSTASTATDARPLRIGEVAARLRTTTRTIRYYEEIGLLPPGGQRHGGAHRIYSEEDVQRLADILRLKELLGLSLEAVQDLLEAEESRRLLRERFQSTDDPTEQRRLAADALGYVERQLAVVRERRAALSAFEHELTVKRRRIKRLLSGPSGGEH